jgi:hypothetical protein
VCGRACTAGQTCRDGMCVDGPSCDGAAFGVPWAGRIPEGASITAYSEATPLGACMAETRTCAAGGTLSGSFTVQTCHPGCGLPWGGNVRHGAMVTGWRNPVEYLPTLCANNTVTCTDGALPLAGFTNEACSQECSTLMGTDVVCTLPPVSGTGTWFFHEVWCVTMACDPVSHFWNRGSPLSGMICTNDHMNGSCTDPDDEWLVTCSPYYVNGTWNCDGASCTPTTYPDAACTGHW